MGLSYVSSSVVSDPNPPDLSGAEFSQPPIYYVTMNYYSNTMDDDLFVTVENQYTPMGGTTKGDRSDFIATNGASSGAFVGNEQIGTAAGQSGEKIYIEFTGAANTYHNQMIQVGSNPPTDPVTFIATAKCAGSPTGNICPLQSGISATIPAGSAVYSPKIEKTIKARVFFANPIVASGVYDVQLHFKQTATDAIVHTEALIIRYSARAAAGAQMFEHQWAVAAPPGEGGDLDRLIISCDKATVFSMPDVTFGVTIKVKNFQSLTGSMIDDEKSVQYTPKVAIDPFDPSEQKKKTDNQNNIF